ncbi:unnamed protein product, partial [Symbiodinium microadriaticum]
VTTPAPGSSTLPRSSPMRLSSRPASSTASALQASSSTSTPGTSSTAGPSPGESGAGRRTPGMYFGSRFIARAPTSAAQRCPTLSASGPPTPGRKPNAWRRRSRLAWTFRPSASRQGSFSAPCRPRHRRPPRQGPTA